MQSSSATPAPSASSESNDGGFHAAPTGGETLSGPNLLVEAYAAIWLCALVFVLVLFRRSRDLEARIILLKDAVARASAKPDAEKAKSTERTEKA